MRLTLRKMKEDPRHTSFRIFANGAYAGDVTLTAEEVHPFLSGIWEGFGPKNVYLEDYTVEGGG